MSSSILFLWKQTRIACIAQETLNDQAKDFKVVDLTPGLMIWRFTNGRKIHFFEGCKVCYPNLELQM